MLKINGRWKRRELLRLMLGVTLMIGGDDDFGSETEIDSMVPTGIRRDHNRDLPNPNNMRFPLLIFESNISLTS